MAILPDLSYFNVGTQGCPHDLCTDISSKSPKLTVLSEHEEEEDKV